MSGSEGLFETLADSTRRAAVVALLERPRTSGELARSLDVTPQALTRHLRILRRVGLTRVDGDERDARLRIYRIEPVLVDPLKQWLLDAERLWSAQLAAFKAHAEGKSL